MNVDIGRIDWRTAILGIAWVLLLATGCTSNASKAAGVATLTESNSTKLSRTPVPLDSNSGSARSGSRKNVPPPKPTPLALPFTPDPTLVKSARVVPSCVRLGGEAKLIIETVPKGGVIWHALYSGTQGGSAPPFGKGHGGEGRGYADDRGFFTSNWTVKISAPPGPARVDVFLAYRDRAGYVGPEFSVADASGSCPE